MHLRCWLVVAFWIFVGVAEAKPSWQAEWDETLKAAKQEGRVVLYVSDVYFEVFQQFQKKYPHIKVTTVSGRGSQISQRVMAERRAGKYLADLYMGGSGTAYNVFYKGKVLNPIKHLLILPEVEDQSKWWGGRHIYHDDESRYILAFNGNAQSYFSYNTKLVNPKKFRSYWDFLDPAWKGKMVSYDPTMGGAVSGVLMFLYKNPQLGAKFIRRILTDMDLRATRDSRQLVNWLAVGKYSLAALVGPNRAGIYRAREQGLPINTFDSQLFKEGGPLSTSNGNVAFFDKSPHPNAAKVALNWLLSREGQMAYQKFGYDKDSLRIDIPKDNVPPRVRRSEGVDYLVLAGPGFKNMDPINKIVSEVWRKRK